MNNSGISLIDDNQIIYIPSYVEEGIEILEDAEKILEEIAAEIESGIGTVNSSGYDRGIPYIEKGGFVSSAIAQMQDTINIITRELENYSNGKNILPSDAIIIADPATAAKYGIAKEDIYCTLADYVEKYGVSPKWSSNYLTAAAGSISYYGKDGRYTRETWCDLDPSNLATLMKQQGIDLDFWIREDGVYMYGDYVMVAADIPHMDGTEQEAEYRKGDLVETSLGTGMVVDLCGMAEQVRKGAFAGTQYADVEVWYDIYTAWHDGGKYEEIGYSESSDSPITGEPTLIQAREVTTTPEVNTPLTTATTLPTTNNQTPSQVQTSNSNTTATPITLEASNVTSSTTTSNASPSSSVLSSSTSNASPSSSVLSSSTSNTSPSSSVLPSSTSNTSPSSSVLSSSTSNTSQSFSGASSSMSNTSSSKSGVVSVIADDEPSTSQASSLSSNLSSSTNLVHEQTSTSVNDSAKNSITAESNANSSIDIIGGEQTVSVDVNSNIGGTSIDNWNVTGDNSNTSPDMPNDVLNDSLASEDKLLTDDNLNETTNQEIAYTVPIVNDEVSPTISDEGVNPIPILTGLGLATAAGVGAKIYMDNKRKTKADEEDEFTDDFEFGNFDSLDIDSEFIDEENK